MKVRNVTAAQLYRVLFRLPFLFTAAAAPLLAQSPAMLPPIVAHAVGSDATIRGLIVARRGDDMYVRAGPDRTLHLVSLTDSTRVVSPAGMMRMSKKAYDLSVLIPGLGVTVEGTGTADGKLMARRVKFAQEALKVAEQIEAGGEVTKMQQEQLSKRQDSLSRGLRANEAATARNRDSIAALKQRALDSLNAVNDRVAGLDKYDVKFTTTVMFKTGDSRLSDAAKRDLDQLVANGTGLTGYLVQVAGYADTTGRSRANQLLSEMRAEAVVEYLTQVKNVPIRRILNPTGFGTSHAIATNATSAGRALNRRAEVTVLVNQGVTGNPK